MGGAWEVLGRGPCVRPRALLFPVWHENLINDLIYSQGMNEPLDLITVSLLGSQRLR